MKNFLILRGDYVKKICVAIFWMIYFVFVFSSCTGVNSAENESFEKSEIVKVSFACWNVQTFFDANTCGTEYSDFQKSSLWTSEKYRERVERLCEVMCSLNSDIFVLEEVESVDVVQDITNFLAGTSWSSKKNWNYACFGKNKGTSIGCAVFSKYEVKNCYVHNFDVRVLKNAQPQTRPVLQVSIDVKGKNLDVFVNHWKSKAGGETESEIWRDWQESLLACRVVSRFDSGNNAFVLCGDFNRDAQEFLCDFDGKLGMDKRNLSGQLYTNVVLRNFCNGKFDLVRVYSPWFFKSGKFTTDKGSYFYNESWERIDNVFAFGSLQISGFNVACEGAWAKENGIPYKYLVYNAEGYSDHLPLVCELLF